MRAARPGVRLALAIGLALGFAWACSAPTVTDGGTVVPGADASVADAGLDGGASGDGGLPVKLACGVLTSRRCTALQRCGLIGGSDDALRACEAFYTTTWCGPTQWTSRVDPSVATLRYDGVKAAACADGLLGRACADVTTLPDACDRFLSPNAQLHQSCYGGGFTECAQGVCRGAACPRTCQARGLPGEVCATDSDCAASYTCRPTSTPGVGQCAAWGKAGDACSSTLPCGAGLGCFSDVCVVLPTSGEACPQGRCDDTSWCASGADGGLCEPRRNRGVACTDDVQCMPTDLCETLSGLCAAVTLKQAGATCGPRQECPTGMACIGLTPTAQGTCLALRKAGEACGQSSDCEAHLACGPADGGHACQPRGLAGAHCDTERDCGPFLACISQACTALSAPGQSCATARRCLWGVCLEVGDAGLTCYEPQGPGAACTVDGDCASARCVRGACLASCVP